jgi:hypothetical protein
VTPFFLAELHSIKMLRFPATFEQGINNSPSPSGRVYNPSSRRGAVMKKCADNFVGRDEKIIFALCRYPKIWELSLNVSPLNSPPGISLLRGGRELDTGRGDSH